MLSGIEIFIFFVSDHLKSVSKQTRKHMKDCAVQSISLIFMTERTQVYFPSPPSFLAPNFLGLWFSLVYGSFNGNRLVMVQWK